MFAEDAETLAVVKKVCKLIAKRDFEQLEELVDEECKVSPYILCTALNCSRRKLGEQGI